MERGNRLRGGRRRPGPGHQRVISSVTIEAINHGMEVLGVYDGFQWLVQGDISHVKTLTIDDVNRIQLRGAPILRTSRTNPAKSEADIATCSTPCRRLGVASLVTIGRRRHSFSGSQSTCAPAAPSASPTCRDHRQRLAVGRRAWPDLRL